MIRKPFLAVTLIVPAGIAISVIAVRECRAQPLQRRDLTFDCSRVLAALDGSVANVDCFISEDLTTASARTTPPDNSLPGLPAGAFVPRTDSANVPGIGPEAIYPIAKVVPGLQIFGAMADNSHARWVIRLPLDWNGRLVINVAAGVRSEYASDITHSNYMVQNGYAYAATNKGHLASWASTPADPKACPQSPPGGPGATSYIHLDQSDLPQDQAFAGWSSRTIETTRLAKRLAAAQFGVEPEFTYLTGISAGALVTRHILEKNPEEFDGGVDWAAPYVNLNRDLNGLIGWFAIGMKNFPDYRDSGFSTSSAGYQALRRAFFPPDLFGAPTANSAKGSFFETHYNGPWQVLECGNLRVLEPDYSGSLGDYDYAARKGDPKLRSLLSAVTLTGRLSRPLISIHGTMDATAALQGSRLYREDVIGRGLGPLYRLYEIQNGTHRDRYKDSPTNFAEIEYMEPHFITAFETLIAWVEKGEAPPRDQCIPRGEKLSAHPRRQLRAVSCRNPLE